ncbi:hypothetical protein GCM10023091_19150 [Ravibacter arvi]|uniref:Uncharacterized protein n=1 Tax=Ravibacter arvi TaxID=2051041 RepID=A0ABP8LZ95_9BACT
MNPGFSKEEINKLRAECQQEKRNFVYVEDEFDEDESIDEHAHIQFIGTFKGEETIYDALIYTIRLHHSALVYDLALERLQKQIPGYLPPEEREAGAKKLSMEEEEEAELLLTELIDEIEENEEVKVQEHVETEPDFDFGIGLEVGLNVEIIDDEIISDFINKFNANQLELDPGVYSFRSEEEEE